MLLQSSSVYSSLILDDKGKPGDPFSQLTRSLDYVKLMKPFQSDSPGDKSLIVDVRA